MIRESVQGHLARVSYNNYDEVIFLPENLGLVPKTYLDPQAKHLIALMARRHMIVHRADRQLILGTERLGLKLIELEVVQQWIEAARAFGLSIIQGIMDLDRGVSDGHD